MNIFSASEVYLGKGPYHTLLTPPLNPYYRLLIQFFVVLKFSIKMDIRQKTTNKKCILNHHKLFSNTICVLYLLSTIVYIHTI